MQDYYGILDALIRDELGKKQTVAIYPFGKVGMQAEDILWRRYGMRGIIIDNNLAKYNPKIIDINGFEEMDDVSISIILCASDAVLSGVLYKGLKERNIKAQIKNILDVSLNQHIEKLEYFERIKKLCRVKRAVGFDMIRIGGNNDGGYIMLDDFGNSNIGYSFGIGGDVSWDEDILHRGLTVYCYDHTIERLPIKNNKLHFNKIGISGSDCLELNLLSMDSILYINKCQNEKNMILKMDVEGAEWEFLANVSKEILKCFSQMTFELHGLTKTKNSGQVISVLQKVNETHQAVWIHANNVGKVEQAGDIVMPDLMEITYVNRDNYEFLSTKYDCPLEIDQPNSKERLDIELINWG